jgi:DNA-directed RNA polymerase
MFTIEGHGEWQRCQLTPEAEAIAASVYEYLMERQIVRLPSVTHPVPWTKARQEVQGVFTTMVKSNVRGSAKVIQEAIDTGSMSRCLDALNRVQSVPWLINEFILDAVERCYDMDIRVKGIPQSKDLVQTPFDDASDEAEIRKFNRKFKGQRARLKQDLKIAKHFVGAPFWIDYRLDYRGRLVPLVDFNFHREDHIRAMFQFRAGQVLDADGLYWLKVHLANCGDFTLPDDSRVSKKSFDERVAWVDANHDAIIRYAMDPFEDLTWTVKAGAIIPH